MKTEEIERTAKFVCFDCRKSFERNWVPKNNLSNCPECKSETIRYDHKFRVPKKNNDKQWKKVEYLRDNGFYFQRVYDCLSKGVYQNVIYPKDLNEAKEFVVKYKNQAIELK